MSQTRILYQFPISHYCEKSRWQMDHKGLPYVARNLLPGPHRIRTRLMANIDTLPVLRDSKRVVGDSTKIAYYLEKYYPDKPLIPATGDARQRVIELEQQFDRYGIYVRRWMYGLVLGQAAVMDAMFDPYHLPAIIKRLLVPVTERGVAKLYGIRPDRVEAARVKVMEGLAQIDDCIKGNPDRYLVGDSLTLADIAAAALYAPLLAPPGTPWDMMPFEQQPDAVRAALQPIRDSAAGQWVLRRYQQDR
ncbi:MAG: glutathione S-transferase family protein [Alcanivoracaceae bacterium]